MKCLEHEGVKLMSLIKYLNKIIEYEEKKYFLVN